MHLKLFAALFVLRYSRRDVHSSRDCKDYSAQTRDSRDCTHSRSKDGHSSRRSRYYEMFSFLSCCSSQLEDLLTPCGFLFGLVLNLGNTMAVEGVAVDIILSMQEEEALAEIPMRVTVRVQF